LPRSARGPGWTRVEERMLSALAPPHRGAENRRWQRLLPGARGPCSDAEDRRGAAERGPTTRARPPGYTSAGRAPHAVRTATLARGDDGPMTTSPNPARALPRTSRSSVAVVNGYVVPVASDPIENGTVLVEDGIITAVGADVVVPDGVPTLDAGGRWVLPGFVEAHAHMGVMEEAEGWAGNDTNEMTDPNGAA